MSDENKITKKKRKKNILNTKFIFFIILYTTAVKTTRNKNK